MPRSSCPRAPATSDGAGPGHRGAAAADELAAAGESPAGLLPAPHPCLVRSHPPPSLAARAPQWRPAPRRGGTCCAADRPQNACIVHLGSVFRIYDHNLCYHYDQNLCLESQLESPHVSYMPRGRATSAFPVARAPRVTVSRGGGRWGRGERSGKHRSDLSAKCP